MTHDPTAVLIAALERAGRAPRAKGPDTWESRCPAHDGERRNLSVGKADDGRALVHCHAHGCNVGAVVQALGLTVADLFPAKERPARGAKGTGALRGRGAKGTDGALRGRTGR